MSKVILDHSVKLSFSSLDGDWYIDCAHSPHCDEGIKVSTGGYRFFDCLLSRMRYRRVILNRYGIKPSGNHSSSLTVNTAHGKRLICLTLQADEYVAFHFKNLIGFTQNIRMHSCLSLSIPSYCTRKNIVQIAKGPGKLLFESSGEATMFSQNQAASQIFSPNRLLVWSIENEFRLDYVYRWWDVFSSQTRLQCQPKNNSILILDADQGNGPHGFWLFKALRDILFPF